MAYLIIVLMSHLVVEIAGIPFVSFVFKIPMQASKLYRGFSKEVCYIIKIGDTSLRHLKIENYDSLFLSPNALNSLSTSCHLTRTTVYDQKFTLFRFQNIILHFKNKLDPIFKSGKTGYRRHSPYYCAEASKFSLSSYLLAAKFEEPFNTSNHKERFRRQYNYFAETEFWNHKKNCQSTMKDSC